MIAQLLTSQISVKQSTTVVTVVLLRARGCKRRGPQAYVAASRLAGRKPETITKVMFVRRMLFRL